MSSLQWLLEKGLYRKYELGATKLSQVGDGGPTWWSQKWWAGPRLGSQAHRKKNQLNRPGGARWVWLESCWRAWPRRKGSKDWTTEEWKGRPVWVSLEAMWEVSLYIGEIFPLILLSYNFRDLSRLRLQWHSLPTQYWNRDFNYIKDKAKNHKQILYCSVHSFYAFELEGGERRAKKWIKSIFQVS